jgi:outer membrane protein assembly factor BamB
MAALDNGVALTSGDSLLVLDSKGTIATTVSKPQPTGAISSPLADSTGIFFADSQSTYHVDRAGHELWRQMLGANLAASEFAAPAPPVLDPQSGRLYVSGLDGALWTFAASDGHVISRRPLPGGRVPRVIQMGLSGLLFVDRTGLSAAGPSVPAIGPFSPDDSLWKGELDDGMGWRPENAIAGGDIGIVAYGYRGSTGEERQTVVLDHCGKLRWRVPGDFSWPVAISFADDLITQDREPSGSGGHTQTIRRFSKDGALLAGPVSTDSRLAARRRR